MGRARLVSGVVAGAVIALVGAIAVAPPAGAHRAQIGPPTNVQLIPVDRAVSVSWTPAVDGAPIIAGYIATAQRRGLPTETCSVWNPQTSCVIGGLVNGKAYQVRVQPAQEVNPDAGPMLVPIGTASSRVTGVPNTDQNCSYVGAWANLQDCSLAGESLIGDDLDGADLEGTNLTDTDLSGANFALADITGAVLTGANLTTTFFNMTDLSGESFAGTNLAGAAFDNESVAGLDFADADLSEVSFISVDFDRADLYGASLESSHFDYSDFEDADFDHADLEDATVGQDDLSGATFTRAKIRGVLWVDSTCPDGTNSDASSPQTCKGHGA